jgi:hypothetical protein
MEERNFVIIELWDLGGLQCWAFVVKMCELLNLLTQRISYTVEYCHLLREQAM